MYILFCTVDDLIPPNTYFNHFESICWIQCYREDFCLMFVSFLPIYIYIYIYIFIYIYMYIYIYNDYIFICEPRHEKTEFSTRADTNRAVQPMEMARGIEIGDLERIKIILSM